MVKPIVTNRYGNTQMATENTDNRLKQLTEQLEASLMEQYGPMLGGANLYKVLGYASSGAFRQALYKNTMPVDVFCIENRRGKFALTKEVSMWLAKQRLQPILVRASQKSA